MPYRSLIEALYTLNSPPIVFFTESSDFELRWPEYIKPLAVLMV